MQKITKYAEDTAIYAADTDINVIKSKLSTDLNAIADWLDQNALIALVNNHFGARTKILSLS